MKYTDLDAFLPWIALGYRFKIKLFLRLLVILVEVIVVKLGEVRNFGSRLTWAMDSYSVYHDGPWIYNLAKLKLSLIFKYIRSGIRLC